MGEERGGGREERGGGREERGSWGKREEGRKGDERREEKGRDSISLDRDKGRRRRKVLLKLRVSDSEGWDMREIPPPPSHADQGTIYLVNIRWQTPMVTLGGPAWDLRPRLRKNWPRSWLHWITNCFGGSL